MKNTSLKALLAAVLFAPITPVIADEFGHWRFDTSLNLFMAGLSGDVAAHGQPVKVNSAFGEVVENLEFAAAGRLTIGYDRWSLSTEVSYLGLGTSTDVANIDLDQWLVEPTVGYRFSDMIEGFA